MNRRDVLRGGVTLATGGVVTAAGLRAFADDAAAAATEFSVAGDTVLLDESGSVAAVWLDATVEWAYDLPNGVQPDSVEIDLLAGTDEDSASVVASHSSPELFLEASGSQSLSADLLAAGVVDGDAIAPEAGVLETDVFVAGVFWVQSADGTRLAEAGASDTSTLTVERDGFEASEYGNVGGSGTLTIESE